MMGSNPSPSAVKCLAGEIGDHTDLLIKQKWKPPLISGGFCISASSTCPRPPLLAGVSGCQDARRGAAPAAGSPDGAAPPARRLTGPPSARGRWLGALASPLCGAARRTALRP